MFIPRLKKPVRYLSKKPVSAELAEPWGMLTKIVTFWGDEISTRNVIGVAVENCRTSTQAESQRKLCRDNLAMLDAATVPNWVQNGATTFIHKLELHSIGVINGCYSFPLFFTCSKSAF
jgi:hypothetical protein